jgi:hypothetical protein
VDRNYLKSRASDLVNAVRVGAGIFSLLLRWLEEFLLACCCSSSGGEAGPTLLSPKLSNGARLFVHGPDSYS